MNYDGHHGPESWDSPGHSYSSDVIEAPVGSWANIANPIQLWDYFIFDFRMLLDDYGIPLEEGWNILREALTFNRPLRLRFVGYADLEMQLGDFQHKFLTLIPAICSKFSLFDIRQPRHTSDRDWLGEVEYWVGHLFEGIPIEYLTPLLRRVLTESQYVEDTSEAVHTKAGQPTQSQSYDCQFLAESWHDDSTRQLESEAYGEAEIYPPSSKDRLVVGMSESGFSRLESLKACARNPGSTEALGVSDTVLLNQLSTERTVDPEHSVVPEKAVLSLPEKEVLILPHVGHRLEGGIRNPKHINASEQVLRPAITDPLLPAQSTSGYEIDELWDILWLKDNDIAESRPSCAENTKKSVDPEPCVLPDPTLSLTESKDSEVAQELCAGANLAASSKFLIASSRQGPTLEHVEEIQKSKKDDKDKTARINLSGRVPDNSGNPGFSQKRLVFQRQSAILIYICLTLVWKSFQLLAPIMNLVICHGISHFSGRKRYRCASHTQLTSTLIGVGGSNSSCSYLNRVSGFPMSLVLWDPGGCLGKTDN